MWRCWCSWTAASFAMGHGFRNGLLRHPCKVLWKCGGLVSSACCLECVSSVMLYSEKARLLIFLKLSQKHSTPQSQEALKGQRTVHVWETVRGTLVFELVWLLSLTCTHLVFTCGRTLLCSSRCPNLPLLSSCPVLLHIVPLEIKPFTLFLPDLCLHVGPRPPTP